MPDMPLLNKRIRCSALGKCAGFLLRACFVGVNAIIGGRLLKCTAVPRRMRMMEGSLPGTPLLQHKSCSAVQTSQSWRARPAAITVLSRKHSTGGLDVKRGNGKGDALDEGKKLEGKKEMADTKRENKRMK